MANFQYIEKRRINAEMNKIIAEILRTSRKDNDPILKTITDFGCELSEIIRDRFKKMRSDYVSDRKYKQDNESLKYKWALMKMDHLSGRSPIPKEILLRLAFNEFARILNAQAASGIGVPHILLYMNFKPFIKDPHEFIERMTPLLKLCSPTIYRQLFKFIQALADSRDTPTLLHNYVFSKRNWRKKYWYLYHALREYDRCD